MKHLIPIILLVIILLPLILCVIAFFLPFILAVLIVNMFVPASRIYFADLKKRKFSSFSRQKSEPRDSGDDVIDADYKVLSSEPCKKE